jgi:hypothetical protein
MVRGVTTTETAEYHDLGTHYTGLTDGAYVDWEGFADPAEAVALVAETARMLQIAPTETLLLDMVLHWVVECIDVAEKPTLNATLDVAAAMTELLRTRRWMASGVDWQSTVAS